MITVQQEDTITEPLRVLEHPALQRLSVKPSQVIDFCKQYNIVEFSLFGSVLRDDFHDRSDVDVLIQFENGYRLSWSVSLELQDKLEILFGRKVDVIRKELVTNPYVKAEIFKTRQVIYGET